MIPILILGETGRCAHVCGMLASFRVLFIKPLSTSENIPSPPIHTRLKQKTEREIFITCCSLEYPVQTKLAFKDPIHREYARGRRERHNCFRPADVAFFSSGSDKNVALIFRKKKYVSIYISIYTRVISWCLTSGEVQHAIRLVYIKNQYVVEDPSGKAADVFPRKLEGFAEV